MHIMDTPLKLKQKGVNSIENFQSIRLPKMKAPSALSVYQGSNLKLAPSAKSLQKTGSALALHKDQ